MPRTILIIDDEEDFRYLLADRLQASGFATLEARDGLEGLEVASEKKPDFIIFDLMMPVMTGEQFWRELQKHPDIKDTPFLILTAKRQSHDRFWGPNMPRADFFSKPCDVNALVKRIREKLPDGKA